MDPRLLVLKERRKVMADEQREPGEMHYKSQRAQIISKVSD